MSTSSLTTSLKNFNPSISSKRLITHNENHSTGKIREHMGGVSSV